MPDIRIKDLTTTAAELAADDFIELDGATNGSRKFDLRSRILAGDSSRAVGPRLISNGSTTSRRVEAVPGTVGNLVGLPVHWPFQFRMPASNPSAEATVVSFSATSVAPSDSAAQLQGLSLSTSGTLTFRRNIDSSNRELITFTGAPTVAANAGQWIRGMLKFTPGSTYPELDFGAGGIVGTTSATVGTPPDFMATATTYWQVGRDWPLGSFRAYAPILGHLTADEVLAWVQTDLLPSWCAAANGNPAVKTVGTATNSSGRPLDVFTGASATGVTIEKTQTINDARFGFTLATGFFVAGQRYRVQFTLTRNSGNRPALTRRDGPAVDSSSPVDILPAASMVDGFNAVEFIASSFAAADRVLCFEWATAGHTFNGAVSQLAIYDLGPAANWQTQPGGVSLADSGANRIPALLASGITAAGDKPEQISVLSQPLTADGFVLADQIVAPDGYKLVDAVPTQTGTSTATITVKETSSGGTTVATGALSASATTVDLTVSNGILAGGKKLHVASTSWTSLTVQIRFNFRRVR